MTLSTVAVPDTLPPTNAAWVTVAIPTYRRADRLRPILAAYFASPAVGKIVLADDFGSNDTLELLRWIQDQNRSDMVELLGPPPTKLGAMRNKIRATRSAARWSEWVCLMDSDNSATHEGYFEPLRAAWIAEGDSVPPRGHAAELRIYAASRYYIPLKSPSHESSWMWRWLCSLCPPPAPEVADFSTFLAPEGHVVTRENYNRVMALRPAGGLMNDGNYVFHRRILHVWEPLGAGQVVDPPGVDVLYMNWHALRQGFSLHVVPGMEYVHPRSTDSFYLAHGDGAGAFIAEQGLERMQ